MPADALSDTLTLQKLLAFVDPRDDTLKVLEVVDTGNTIPSGEYAGTPIFSLGFSQSPGGAAAQQAVDGEPYAQTSTIAATGTPQVFDASPTALVNGCVLYAGAGNAADILVGDSSSQVVPIQAGSWLPCSLKDLNQLTIKGTLNDKLYAFGA